jgi:ABC-2 type transport system permease protein
MSESLTATGLLIRHALRLDRIRLAVWVLGTAFVPVVTYWTYASLYPTPQDRLVLGATLKANPAFSLLLGPAGDLTGAGGYTAWRTIVITTIFVAVMSILTVIRHTRTDEENGRTELLAAGCVGRFAFLASGLATAAIACVASGLAIAVGLLAAGASPTGTIAYAAAVTLGGILFGAVAAVTAELASFGRTAISLAIGVLAATYILRAWGDASSVHWVSWLSPLGWTEKIDAFTLNRWWTLALPVALTAVLAGISVRLAATRDFGRGLIAAHHGPATAPDSLAGAFGLAWRLHRARLVGWALGLAAYGALIGSVTTSIASVIAHSAIGKTFLGGSANFADLYLAEILNVMGIVASIYGIQAMLTARSEEIDGRVELVLSTPLTRWRWLASHMVFALGGSAIVVIAGGLGAGVTARLDGAATSVTGVLGGALAQIPAIWVVVGLTALIFALVPRLSVLGWSIVAASFVISFFGPLLKLPRPVLDLSAFTHVPRLPGGPLEVAPLLWLGGLAAVLVVGTFIAFRRRSIVS